MIQGIQSQGVAATAKHFPGHGDTIGDSHHSLTAVPHNLERLRAVELPPFRAAIEAGVKLVMSAHLALPALDGPKSPPATLSHNVLQNLLRRELGFGGVIVSDAMDMRAIRQEQLDAEALRAAQAGIDLLLLTANAADQKRVHLALLRAIQEKRIPATGTRASARRVLSLKTWLSAQQNPPPLEVIGCAEHRQVADEIAERSITLVRDHAKRLPLRPHSQERIAVILPRPADLTPADTSSTITPSLARFIREHHPLVDEFLVPFAPTPNDISALREEVRRCNYLVIGTINAFDQPKQQSLVQALLETGIPTILVALRLPYDFPQADTYLCTYSILEPSLRALVKTLFGVLHPAGHLPVSIPGLYPLQPILQN